MSALFVKICGLTRARDVAAAVALGADAVGFVFAGGPRLLDAQRAAQLGDRVPRGIKRVGLFMDQAAHEVEAVLDVVALDLLQFHGREQNDWCAAFGLPFIKSVSMRTGDPEAVARAYPDAVGILLDSHEPGQRGGTGETFDWRRRPTIGQPIWLAGGLTPDNVAEAVRQFTPYAVDVSSGVESAPGIKDEQLIRQFIEKARQA